MTTFTAATDLKAGVDTESKLLLYALSAVHRMYSAKTYNEVEGQPPAPVITMNIVRADDGTERAIGRYSIPLASNWREDTANQLWALAQELGTVSWPTEYKV